MKRNLLIITVAFVVTLTTIFGFRASADALAVVFGVVLGVVASVPTTFLVTYLLTRPRSGYDATSPPSFPQQQPPVVVINASEKPAISGPATLPALSPPAQTRKWTVIGDTETEP
jgi:hypothetical protein